MRLLPLALLLPWVASAQPALVGETGPPGGTVLGRVCLDLDRDGRCGEGDPGVAGARVLGEDGKVAAADGAGRFHLLEVPARVLAEDLLAYGTHVLAAEGLGVSRRFEVAPSGAAQVDLPVAGAEGTVPAVSAAPTPRVPTRRGAALAFALALRSAAATRIEVGGKAAEALGDGLFAAEVELRPGENVLPVLAEGPGGGVAAYRQAIRLVPRAEGGDLIVPSAPEPMAAFRVEPRPGGALVHGRAAPGTALAVAGSRPRPTPSGAFAAWVPARGGPAAVEIAAPSGPAARMEVATAATSGIRAAAALLDVEVAFGGGEVVATGRGAASLSARLGPAEVEAGVDLDDRDRDATAADLLRPRDGLAQEHALDPSRTFPTAGDQGASGDRDPGRGRLHARIEVPGARLDLGPARTGLTGSELGRYDRAFFGARAVASREIGPVRLEASAFGATLRPDSSGAAPPVPAHDALAATGGSLYWLRHGDLVAGSEAVRVEWTDPATGRVAARRALVRGVDYQIDPAGGWIALAAPLPPVAPPAALETGEPFAAAEAVLHVDYLHAGGSLERDDLAGGRLGLRAGPLALAAQAASEDRTGGAYRLLAGSAGLDLGPALRLRAEVARSRGSPFPGPEGFSVSGDGGFTYGVSEPGIAEATAFQLEGEGEVGPARWAGWWRERPAGFADGTRAEAADARERGVEASVTGGSLRGEVRWAERRGADPLDPAGATADSRRALARGRWTRDRLSITAEILDEEIRGPSSGETTGAGLRAAWRISPGLEVEASHLQALRTTGSSPDPTFAGLGASLERGPLSLRARAGWGPDLGPRLVVGGERRAEGEAVYGTFTVDPDAPSLVRERTSVLGVRQRAGSAELFTEEEFARDPFGLRTGRIAGATLAPAAGLRVTLRAQAGERIRPDGERVDRSAAGAALSLVRGAVHLSGRGEVRREGGDDQVLLGGAAEWLATRRLSLSAHATWSDGAMRGRSASLLDAALGAAFRWDRASALARVAAVAAERPGEPRRRSILASAAATARVAARLEMGAAAHLGWSETGEVRDDRLSGSVRAAVRVAGPFDLAAELARRGSLRGDAPFDRDAVRAEAGLSLGAGRIALGYNLVGFGGSGVEPEEETGRLFLRATLSH
ncbi:MAG TPA: hypothetical protein VLS93_01080 [Anaeromyxobacteraceae bacterium]|nr:hypothetical protein [Anaeromyxobacteraceae bacterium]